MFTRMVRGSLSSDAVYASGVASLVSGISILIAANFAISSFRSAPDVTVDFGNLTWLSKAKVSALSAGSVEKLNAALPSDLTYAPLPQRRLAAKIVIRAKAKPHRDAIQISRAAPAIAVEPVLTEPTEAQKLENIHLMLRARFIALAIDVAPVQMVTQVQNLNNQKLKPRRLNIHPRKKSTLSVKAVSSPAQTNDEINTKRAFEPETQPVDSTQVLLAALQSQENLDLNRAIQAIAERVSGLTDSQKSIEVNNNAHEKLVSHQSNDRELSDHLNIQKAVQALAPVVRTSEERLTTGRADGPPKPDKTESSPESMQAAALHPAAPARLTDKIEDRVVTTQSAPIGIFSKNEYSPKVGYPGSFPGKRAWYIKDDGAPANPAPRPEVVPTPKPTEPADRFKASAENKKSLTAVSTVDPSSCLEAFNWAQEIPYCDHRALTQEFVDAAASPGSWVLAQAKDHWPTLHWKSGRNFAAPVISNNSSILLSKIAETNIQAEAGIVFGKLSPGWNVSISGRADQPIILNSRNELINAANADSETYFAFLNAEPGAALVYFKNSAKGTSGSVAIPVLNGSATFVDLSRISFKKVSGKVFNAEARRARGLRGVAVTVIDQPQSAITGNDGSFQIERIAVVDDMPVYLETGIKDEYPQRYRVPARQLNEVALYRFSENTVDDWVSQIEGGVSSESALIIGAVPQLVSAAPQKQLFASVRSLLETQVLVPETYSLSSEGELKLQTQLPISGIATRFMAVQIPGGPVVVGAKDDSNAGVWSELLLTSPRVISVVGPY